MRRLDPKSILIMTVEWLRKAIFPLVLSLVSSGRTLSRADELGRSALLIGLGIPAAFGVLAIVGSIITYMVTQFGVVNGALVVVRKGLWRQERTIPLERIQNVRITQGLLERLLRIATLQVETASGSGVEASLKSLSVADAEFVKGELMRTSDRPTPDAAPPVVYQAELRDIVLAGALQNRAMIMIAAILGLFGQGIDDAAEAVFGWLTKNPVVDSASRNPVSFGFMIALFTVIVVLIGWLLSISYALFMYYGFKVVRTEHGIQISYGLVNTVQTAIPLRRIQSVQTRASWLYRLLGLNQLYVQSIGGHSQGEGEAKTIAAGQTLVAPICRPPVLRQMIRLLHPGLDVDQVKFLASEPFKRNVSYIWITVSFTLPWLALLLVRPNWSGLPWILALYGLTGLLAYWLTYLAFRRQGYARTPEAFMVCSGTLGQQVIMVPLGNIQAVTLESGHFMRRSGLVDLTVSTPVSEAKVPCIPRPTAEALRDDLIAASFGRSRRGI